MTTPQIIRVKVTEKDIQVGERKRCHSCPVALAAQRETGTECWMGVTAMTVGSREYRVCKNTTAFVNDFDRGIPVKPFTAVLRREK